MKSKTNSDTSGFIKLDRKILDWEWWDDINTFRLFMTILLMANWEDKKWHGRTIKRGQLWTSLESLSKKSGLTLRQTRWSLDKLIMTNEVTNEVTNKGRLITVEKYDFYQSDKRKVTNKTADKASAKCQTSDKRSDKRVTTTKEVIKETKEVIKEQQEQQGGGRSTTIDLNELLSIEDIAALGRKYLDVDSLLTEVEREVNDKGRRIRSAAGYVEGYAKNVGWPTK